MAPGHQTRDSIQDVWGPRTPYKHQWPPRIDERCIEEPQHWVQSACVLCRWVSNNDKDRLRFPLIRRQGRLQRASWEEAMSLVVEKTKEVQKRLTNHGIGFYTSGQLFLEEYYALALVGKGGLHTLHMDGNTRLCTATAAASLRESFGSDGQPGSYADVDFTDCLFIVGQNVSATQTVLWSRILDRLEGTNPPKIIVVDPRTSNTAKRATVHLAPRIGTNMAILNGIQHLMFENGWVDEGYINKHVIGVEELRKKVKWYTPERVEEITGIPIVKLKQAVEILGTTKSLLSTVLQGVYQSNQATASACQINNINLLRGLIGQPGSGIYQMNGQPTAQNNREAGCDGEYPGFRNFMNPSHMKEIADIWNLEVHQVPHWNQPTHVQNMLKFIENGSMEMFWISGTNPLVSLPNLPRIRNLLTKPELFVVCQDIFLTETAAIADVVLPAAQWGEKTGCFTNVDRTVHISRKAIEPPGEAKSDFEIFVDFAKRMDFRDKDGNPLVPWTEPEQAFNAWKRMSKGRPCDYSGLSYDKLTGGSGVQWPCNADNPDGKERLFVDGNFFTDIDYCESFGHDLETGAPITEQEYKTLNPAGRAILKAADYIPSLEAPNEEYPLQLSTGRQVYHFHTRTKTGRSKELNDACQGPMIEISPEDAITYDVKDGEEVVVKSRRGAVQMPVYVGKIAKGQVFMPFHYGYWDSSDGKARAANELTREQWDPISKQPMFKSGAVRIEKIEDESGLVQIYAKEEHTATVRNVEVTKSEAQNIGDQKERERHLEFWLGATYEAIELLLEICDTLSSQLVKDHEVCAGLKVISKIGERMRSSMEPIVSRYGERKQYGRSISKHLRDSLFPPDRKTTNPYEELVTLQSLYMYLSHVQSHITALLPASQALWDHEFIKTVTFCKAQASRQLALVQQQIKVKSPQTLLVPSTPLGNMGGTGIVSSTRQLVDSLATSIVGSDE